MTCHRNQLALLSVAAALTKVIHDHLITKFNRCFSSLTLLDFSGACDTIDHSCVPETFFFPLASVLPHASKFLFICLLISLQGPLFVLYFEYVGVPQVWS